MRRISCLSLVATSAAALVLAAFHGPTARGATAHSCAEEYVHAVVAGHHRCLRRGVICRSRLNAAYHRYLFHCNGGYLVYWWSGLLRRPLHMPTLGAGEPCPAAAQRGTLGDQGSVDASNAPAFGPGPAYPTLSSEGGRAVLGYFPSWGYEGWDGTKLLWTVPQYNGPYIVRGRQLNGPNELRFDQGPNWSNRLHSELRLAGPYPWLNPAATFLRTDGCYAYQVDGRGFSYLIVFEARRAGAGP